MIFTDVINCLVLMIFLWSFLSSLLQIVRVNLSCWYIIQTFTPCACCSHACWNKTLHSLFIQFTLFKDCSTASYVHSSIKSVKIYSRWLIVISILWIQMLKYMYYNIVFTILKVWLVEIISYSMMSQWCIDELRGLFINISPNFFCY